MPVRFEMFNETDLPSSGGWVYVDPDLGVRLNSRSLGKLLNDATKLRIANKLVIPKDWPRVFRSLICEQMGLGPRSCREVQETPEQKTDRKRKISFGDVRNFLHVLTEWISQKPEFVSPEEASRRASICAQCPENIPATGCGGCANIAGMVTKVIGNRRTPDDEKLQNCGVCGCSNQAQVHVPLEVLAKGVTPDMEFPTHCWKKKAVDRYQQPA